MLSGIAIMLGLTERGGALQGIATIPEFFWELSLGIYCVVKGFKPFSHHRGATAVRRGRLGPARHARKPSSASAEGFRVLRLPFDPRRPDAAGIRRPRSIPHVAPAVGRPSGRLAATGHAELIRESVDGLVGEEPPD